MQRLLISSSKCAITTLAKKSSSKLANLRRSKLFKEKGSVKYLEKRNTTLQISLLVKLGERRLQFT